MNFYKPFVALILVLTIAWQCQPQATSKPEATPTPKETPMTNNLDNMTFGYQIGIPAWEGGQTTLTINPNGEAIVKNETDGQEPRQFTATLPPTELQTLYTLIKQADLLSQTQRQTAVLDEALVLIHFKKDEQIQHTVTLWENQFQETEALQAFRQVVRGHIATISNNAVY